MCCGCLVLVVCGSCVFWSGVYALRERSSVARTLQTCNALGVFFFVVASLIATNAYTGRS